MLELLIVILAFLGMEFTAWAAHKYVMHGFLWWLHEDHHVLTGKPYQKNDYFALIFATPSALGFIFGSIYNSSLLIAFGLGILLYGLAYLFVHDIFIHRRKKMFKKPNNKYLKGILFAHRIHHSKSTKNNCEHFGMLFVPKVIFRLMKNG